MADYFAVLQRTLAGFSDPKPQLRSKLYERARTTIQRQLEGRTPPIDAQTLAAEMHKLEEAITSIERGFDPSYAGSGAAVPAAPAPAAPAAPAQPAADMQPPAPPAAPPPVQQPPAFDPVAELAIPDAPPKMAPSGLPPAEVPPAAQPQTQAAPSTVVAAADASADAVDQWAREFMQAQNQPAAQDTAMAPAAEQPAAAPGSQDAPRARPVDPDHDYSDPALTAGPAATARQPERAEPAADSELTIPPAPGFGARRDSRPKKRGTLRWILLLALLGLLGAGGYFGWVNRDTLVERLGLNDVADEGMIPKPVKTITIKPEPAAPAQEGEGETKTEEPKSESRLTPNGATPEQSQDSGQAPVVLPPTTGDTEGSGDEQAADTGQTGVSPAVTQSPSGGIAVSQNAILYEEGSTSAENTVDSGRVVWSVVQEEPAPGEPKEPAIRARVEIPSRNVVLIMTIKRNADKALPASHLIELVFAVPDDFSGGAIGQINRFVLKESEQGRGEGLVAVPARIADGIFLIALNNLEQAVKTNEQLLQERDWIDIPMQYRTGRRALVTIEKGIPGDAVFKEVFEAWKNL